MTSLPQSIGPDTEAETSLLIKKDRRDGLALMATAGANQVNMTIEVLTQRANDYDAQLLAVGLPGESLPQIAARIEADGESTTRLRTLVNNYQSGHMSLEAEQRTKSNQAEDFDTKAFENSVSELKSSFETAMSTEINRVAIKWNIPRADAKNLVDQDLAARGTEAVLPIYHRIYSRFAQDYPQQLSEASA